MNVHTYAARLKAANINVLRVDASEDEDQEDHDICVTETISIQVPSQGGARVSVVARLSEDTFWFGRERKSNDFDGLKADIA
jgi:hypothetical protein